MSAHVNDPVAQMLGRAIEHHQAGRMPQAEQLYRQILAQQPNHANALNLLGVLAAQAGRNDIAVNLIRQAIAVRPNFPEAHSNLGNVLKDTGQLDEAIAAHRQAIALKPNYPEAYSNLANALNDKGQQDQAIAAYRQAIALRPNLAEAHYNLGNALKDKGQLDQAIAAYWQAIALRPNWAQAHNNLGNALKGNGQLDEAITACRQAIALRPNYPEAHSNLGVAMHGKGQLDEAIAAHRQAIVLWPNLSEAHYNLGNALKDSGQLDQAIVAYRQAIALRPNWAEAHTNLVLTLNYHPTVDDPAIAEEIRRWNQQHAEPLAKFILPHRNDRTPDRRLRIGYVSPDFRQHAVAYFLLPLLKQHDDARFEIFCYAQVPAPDGMTQQLRTHADHWHSLVGLTDEQAAALIRSHQIDILVDLAGHTAHNRLLLFARKPVPVQVTYLGYPGSTGLTTIDYRLTDALADPPGLTEAFHSEQLLRLPICAWCYEPLDSPAITPRPQQSITFGCFNNFSKITEPMLQLWARILQTVPDSTLLLKGLPLAEGSSTCQHIRELMQSQGIASERLQLLGHTPSHAEHVALYNQIDIALDTFPYHGTTTTCEALWMGVPVVSLAGQSHVSRVGVSLLSNAGLAELIARDSDEYVQIAAALADDRPRLAELRATLRQRMQQSPLMDAPRFARDIEAGYRRMWRTWCSSM